MAKKIQLIEKLIKNIKTEKNRTIYNNETLKLDIAKNKELILSMRIIISLIIIAFALYFILITGLIVPNIP